MVWAIWTTFQLADDEQKNHLKIGKNSQKRSDAKNSATDIKSLEKTTMTRD